MILVAMSFGIAAVVWCLVLAFRGSLLVASAAYLAIAAAAGYQFWHFDVAGITLSADRLLLLGLIAGLILQWKLLPSLPFRWGTSESLLVLFACILMASMFSHDWRRSIGEQDPIPQHFVEGYLIPFGLYFLARCSLRHERNVQGAYLVLGVFACYLAVTAIMEVARIWGFVYPKYIADPTLGIHFGRARGPFLQSVRLGIYLTAGLAAVWIPLVWRRTHGKPGQLVGFCASLLIMLASLLTYTRSIWVGLGAGLAIVAALTFTPRYRRFCMYCLVVAAVCGIPLKDQLLELKREYGSQETLESTKMRAVFAYVSWQMFKDRPLSGFGFGHFGHEKEAYLDDHDVDLRLESIRGYIHHNTYLSLLVELGLFGFLAFIFLMCSWVMAAMKIWRNRMAPDWMRGHALAFSVILATCAIQMLFHEVSYSPFENGILFFMAGITTAIMAKGSEVHVTERSGFGHRRPGGWVPGPVWGKLAANSES